MNECGFFFNDTATTEIYTLSLHDALPIFAAGQAVGLHRVGAEAGRHVLLRHRGERTERAQTQADRKSTRLNSSHANISYAVFCLKKKKKNTTLSSEDHKCASVLWSPRLNS